MAGVVLLVKVFEAILAECQNEKSLTEMEEKGELIIYHTRIIIPGEIKHGNKTKDGNRRSIRCSLTRLSFGRRVCETNHEYGADA
jgi:hypothetical protein